MIYLGADHGGYALKEKIKQWLDQWQLPYKDLGPHELDPEDDYPVYAFAVADRVGREDNDQLPWGQRVKGIVACRSAVGVVMSANKVKGVRAGAIYDHKAAIHARTNDDTNIIGLSGDWTSDSEAKKIIKTWLATEFSRVERHVRRLNLIKKRENMYS